VATRRADLSRSVLEGVAFAIREIVEAFAHLGLPIQRIHITGGGARSLAWRQLMADVLGFDLAYIASDSTLGAAMVTAVGLGLQRDFPSAVSAMMHVLGETHPDRRAAEVYERVYAQYRRLRDVLLERSDGALEQAHTVGAVSEGD